MKRPGALYGLWSSPITPEYLSHGKRLCDVAWDSDGQTLTWLEERSDRGIVVSATLEESAPRDLTSALSVGARVGYGGGDFTASHGSVFFVSGGRMFRQYLAEGEATAITPPFGLAASPAVSPDGQWVLYVHSCNDVDRLAIVDSCGRHWPQKLVEGDDFYMNPVWHPDGRRVAWVSWNHPNMPWDGTHLNVARLALQTTAPPMVRDKTVVAGAHDTAISQPQFSPDGRSLAYISDASGWDNLYAYDLETQSHCSLVNVEAELGSPAKQQGMRTYGWSPDSARIHFVMNRDGAESLWSVDCASGARSPIDAMREYVDISQLSVSCRGTIAARVSASRVPPPASRLPTLAGRQASTASGPRAAVAGTAAAVAAGAATAAVAARGATGAAAAALGAGTEAAVAGRWRRGPRRGPAIPTTGSAG